MLFGPKLPIDAAEFEWLCACMAWIGRTLGERDARDGFVPNLTLPGDAALSTAATASELFDVVKLRAGLDTWHCELEQSEAPRDDLELGLVGGGFQSSSHALGTFSVEGNTPIIRYDPNLLRHPPLWSRLLLMNWRIC